MTRQISRPVHILSPAGRTGTGEAVDLRRVAEVLEGRGEAVTLHRVPGDHPSTTEEARLEADAIVARIPDGAVLLVEGALLPAAAHALYIDRFRLRIAALVSQPSHGMPGLSPERADLLRRIEGPVLAHLRRVIVPGPEMAAEAAALGADPRRIGQVVALATTGGEPSDDTAALADALRCELARIVPQDQRIERIA